MYSSMPSGYYHNTLAVRDDRQSLFQEIKYFVFPFLLCLTYLADYFGFCYPMSSTRIVVTVITVFMKLYQKIT